MQKYYGCEVTEMRVPLLWFGLKIGFYGYDIYFWDDVMNINRMPLDQSYLDAPFS